MLSRPELIRQVGWVNSCKASPCATFKLFHGHPWSNFLPFFHFLLLQQNPQNTEAEDGLRVSSTHSLAPVTSLSLLEKEEPEGINSWAISGSLQLVLEPLTQNEDPHSTGIK